MIELWPFLLGFGLVYKCIYLHMHLCVNSKSTALKTLYIEVRSQKDYRQKMSSTCRFKSSTP